MSPPKKLCECRPSRPTKSSLIQPSRLGLCFRASVRILTVVAPLARSLLAVGRPNCRARRILCSKTRLSNLFHSSRILPRQSAGRRHGNRILAIREVWRRSARKLLSRRNLRLRLREKFARRLFPAYRKMCAGTRGWFETSRYALADRNCRIAISSRRGD